MHICLSTAYLAPVEYYAGMVKADSVLLEQQDYYVKQSYRNRCNIASANGILSLSIPVDKTNEGKTLIRDVRISRHSDWQIQHWRAIESAYNSSPFFEYYKDDLLPFYTKDWNFLWDFNQAIQDKVLELLGVTPTIVLTKEYKAEQDHTVTDLRDTIHPKKKTVANLKEYYQVFKLQVGFIPNLSIIDLLFNMGNESILILES